VAAALCAAGRAPEAVVLEDRTRMLSRGAGIAARAAALAARYGARLAAAKAAELAAIRAHYAARRLLPRWDSREYLSAEEAAFAFGLRLVRVKGHNDPEAESALDLLKPDALLTVNARILEPRIFRRAPLAFNLHLSALPAYGGMDSVFWALYDGKPTVGVTVHRIEERLDAGEIFAQESVAVLPGDTEASVYRRALELGCALVVRVLEQADAGRLAGRPMPGPVEYRRAATARDRAAFRRRRRGRLP